MNKFSIIFLASVLVISSNISAQTSDQEKSSWWDTTKKFLDDSQKNISDRVGNLNKTLDEEIEELLNNDATELDTIKKSMALELMLPNTRVLKKKIFLTIVEMDFQKVIAEFK